MKRNFIIMNTILGIILITAIIVGPVMSNVEKPNYQVIDKSNNIEIRQYQPSLIAEVEISGNRKDAISNGFRLLADFIFGNNKLQNLTISKQDKKDNHKIAMTAPVEQQASGTNWKVNFIMPAGYDLNSIPLPNNPAVKLKEIPAKSFIVIKFSGTSSDKNLAEHEKELRAYIQIQNINIIEPAKYAFYNPPWTLPLLRRNEVMFEIKKANLDE